MLKTTELLRNAVSHAPRVQVSTEWVEDIQDIYKDGAEEDAAVGGTVNIEIEAGPNLPILS